MIANFRKHTNENIGDADGHAHYLQEVDSGQKALWQLKQKTKDSCDVWAMELYCSSIQSSVPDDCLSYRNWEHSSILLGVATAPSLLDNSSIRVICTKLVVIYGDKWTPQVISSKKSKASVTPPSWTAHISWLSTSISCLHSSASRKFGIIDVAS